jgi:two-component system response regulator BaeR
VNPRTILIVEDEEKLAAVLQDYLRAAGFAPVVCGDGNEVLQRFESLAPALVLLDLMLPGLDGTEVCRTIRRGSAVPIIMVTARVDEVDRLLGLELGADDYVCKPFSPREVVARVRALLRRADGAYGSAAGAVALHGFRFDDAGFRVSWGETPLNLTPIEYRLLRTLVQQPERVLNRGQLLDAMHVDFKDTTDRTVDSHVRNLRRKLDAAGAGADRIASVYGVGYRFEPELPPK